MRTVAEGHEWQQTPAVVHRGISSLGYAVPRLHLWASRMVEAYDGDQRHEALDGAPGR